MFTVQTITESSHAVPPHVRRDVCGPCAQRLLHTGQVRLFSGRLHLGPSKRNRLECTSRGGVVEEGGNRPLQRSTLLFRDGVGPAPAHPKEEVVIQQQLKLPPRREFLLEGAREASARGLEAERCAVYLVFIDELDDALHKRLGVGIEYDAVILAVAGFQNLFYDVVSLPIRFKYPD